MRCALAALTCVLLLAGCGSETPGTAGDPGPSTRSPVFRITEAPDRPPPVVVVADGEELTALQGSFCWTSSDGAGMCEDKIVFPVSALPDAGEAPAVELRFPIWEARFTASLAPLERPEGETSYRGQVTSLGEGRYRLTTTAPPGRYRVFVTGRMEAGEAPGEFLWTVPR